MHVRVLPRFTSKRLGTVRIPLGSLGSRCCDSTFVGVSEALPRFCHGEFGSSARLTMPAWKMSRWGIGRDIDSSFTWCVARSVETLPGHRSVVVASSHPRCRRRGGIRIGLASVRQRESCHFDARAAGSLPGLYRCPREPSGNHVASNECDIPRELGELEQAPDLAVGQRDPSRSELQACHRDRRRGPVARALE